MALNSSIQKRPDRVFSMNALFLPAAIADRSSNTLSCCCWGGEFFSLPLDDLVAQSCTNSICRS